MSASFEALARLLELIYSAAEDSALWSEVLAEVCRVVDGVGATLVSHDLTSSGSAAWFSGFNPEALRLYNEHFHRVDAWALAASDRKLRTSGPVVADEQLIPRAAFLRTEFSDFLRRYDIGRMMHATFALTPEGTTGLSIYRSPAGPPFDSAALDTLRTIRPHLIRALRLHDALADARVDRQISLEALDVLPVGVLVLTATGQVVHANREARTILKQRDGLWSDPAGLRGATPVETAALRRICGSVAPTPDSPESGGGVLTLPRPSGRRPLQLRVGPVGRNQAISKHAGRVHAIVFVTDPERTPAPDVEVLQAAFDLTQAEARVAAALVGGDELAAIADTLGYTKATVQWYSKQVLAKTGARNRTDLVRLLLASIAVCRPTE
ncbi:MAG: helix-turn-helix transcriptional regulator [Vicinamibacterales bacterium]